MIYERDYIDLPGDIEYLPYDLHMGLNVEKPKMFLKWNMSKNNIADLLKSHKDYNLNQAGDTIYGATVFGMDGLLLTFAFVYENTSIAFFQTQKLINSIVNEKEIYNNTQIILEKIFGTPELKYQHEYVKRWNFGMVNIEHEFWYPPYNDIIAYDTISIRRTHKN